MSNEREQRLEEVLAQILRPVRGRPFEEVIRLLYDVAVEKFDLTADENRAILNRIAAAMRGACGAAQETPIECPRPNEVGNDMEKVVINALMGEGLPAAPPLTRKGGGRATGYPDVRIETGGLPIYLEVKTYAAATHETTQRSFYLSPSDDPKVVQEAYHLLVGFEMEDRGVNGCHDDRGRALRKYCPVGFVITDLYGLDCDMKSEFNSDNRRLHDNERTLVSKRVG